MNREFRAWLRSCAEFTIHGLTPTSAPDVHDSRPDPLYTRYTGAAMATPDLYGQAVRALEQGRGADATTLLVRALKRSGLDRDEQMQVRCALAEAWLLQDDIRQATEALGRPPEARERLDPARLSDLWRMHGRLAAARGEPSRGIAFLTKALQSAERAHDSRAIGLSHFELGLCYRQVGDTGIVREHLTQAASALHAVGDRRHLAMVHSLSGVTLAQEGRLDEAMSALSQAERLAVLVEAGDVLATVCGNQANVALMQHRHEQALTLAERSVELQEQGGTPHGLGVALASLGQICVRLGSLNRAEEALNRALDVRSPLQFMRETTGAVFDTLAQIHLIRGQHEEADRCLSKARDAYGEYGSQTARWYQWSLLVLQARVALRRGPARAGRGPCVRCRQVGRRAAWLRAPGRAHRRRSAPGLEPGRGSPAAPRRRQRAHQPDGDERHVGRVPAPARPPQSHGWPLDRGVSRLRPERQRLRAARRASPGRAELPGTRPARSGGRRALAGDPLSHRRDRDLRSPRRGPRPGRGHGRRSPKRRRLRPAAMSASRWTARTRSSAGSSMRRSCRRSSRARARRPSSRPATRRRPSLFIQTTSGQVKVASSAGCDPTRAT